MADPGCYLRFGGGLGCYFFTRSGLARRSAMDFDGPKTRFVDPGYKFDSSSFTLLHFNSPLELLDPAIRLRYALCISLFFA
jgi:hypothetical protein